jgi:protein-S-isoprenylcysteine O-methyltransferase Ste14
MEAKLLLIPWMVSVLYSSIPLFWFAIHPFTDRWRRMLRSPYRLLLPIWAGILALLVGSTWPWKDRQIYSVPLIYWFWIPALPLFALSLYTYSRIFSEFGAHRLSGEAELRPAEHEQVLVTAGLHSRLRHPIYVAHLCHMAAWTLAGGLLVSFILLGISLFLTFPWMIWLEERELEKRFGQSFRDYKRTVPLLPRKLFFKTRAESANPSKLLGSGREV